MKRIPAGKLITINEIRTVLARRHRLPDDDRDLRPDRGERGGRSRGARTDEEGTPYWRTLKTGAS